MTARLMIINGPNLNYLGVREPQFYGHTTLEMIEAACRRFADACGAELAFHQSNFEGKIVEFIQSAGRAPTPSSSIRRPIPSPRLPSSMR